MHTPQELARSLWEEHRERIRFHSIRGLLAAPDLDSAYAAQDELVRLMIPAEGEPRGYKIGLTSLRVQQMCGLSEPIAGRILERRIHHGPTDVELGRFGRLGVESEVCVILKEDLPLRAAPYSLAEIGAAIGAVAAAFELIDDRDADYAQLDALSLVADNSWNAGVVLAELAAPQELGELDGTLKVNGLVADRGNSRDALSHPLAVVAWLVNHLRRYASWLRAGELVMTGSIVPTRFARANEHYHFELAGLPAAELKVV